MTTEGRWWPEVLNAAEAATLSREDHDVDRRPELLVVGGGVMGVAIADAAERADLGSVVLLEGARLGSGSTGGAAGLLTPEPHVGVDHASLVDLGRESLAAWRCLDADVPGGLGVADLEWLGLLPPDADGSDRSPHGQLLEPDDVHRLVPGLVAPRRGLYISGQARVNPLRAVARLAARLDSVTTDVRVTAVAVHGGRVTSVETSAGTFSPGVVVFATANPPDVAGVDPPVRGDVVRGHILVTEPVPLDLPGTVDPICTPLEGGRLLIGGTLDMGRTHPAVDPQIVQGMLDELARWLPELARTRVERVWSCFRPHHSDGLPTIDRVPGVDNAWFTSGHYRTGILMAPATGAITADWIASGARPVRAEPFALDRSTLDPSPPDVVTA